jgi:hypothetical protein
MYNLKKYNVKFWFAVISIAVLLGCARKPMPPLSPLPQEHYKVHFESSSEKVYPPTKIEKLEIFQSIKHFKGLKDIISKKETPKQAYDIIGIVTLDEDWYFASMLDGILKQKLEEVGGDAILKYEMFQTSAARIKREDNGQIEDLYRMSVKATVIRFQK